jgi:two-component system sensor histidine kinase KdpD
MLEHVRAIGVGGTWAGSERIVVAVNELPGADGLVRAAKRIADAQRAPWTALYVETPRAQAFGEPEHRSLATVMNLATQLGGEVTTVPAASVFDGIRTFVAEARGTQLIVGKSQRSRLFELRHGSVVDRLVREMPDIAVHVMPMRRGGTTPPLGRHRAGYWGTRSGYVWTSLMVSAVTAAASGLFHILNLGNVALLYLLPVMAAASLFGLRTGLYGGLVSSLSYNFFFLPPTGTLTVSNPENIVSIFVLLGVAVATSQLTARVRAQADLAASSARTNAALAGFLRRLTPMGDPVELARAICDELARLFGLQTVLLAPGGAGLVVQAASEAGYRLDTMEMAAAQWAFETGTPAGKGSGTLAASEGLFQPLRSGEKPLAVMGLARDSGGDPVRSDQLPLLVSLLDQAALVLERLRLEGEMRGVDEVRTRDRLRAALLSSVSHDLRTPLTAIMAAAAELHHGATPDLIGTIEGEAVRLNRFVANLLDMARVEAGALKLKVEAVDLGDAVAGAAHDARRALEGHAIRLDVPPALPLVRVDQQLLHHCLLNLLDNAGRYADPGTPIVVEGVHRYGTLTLSILDQGPGLPPGREAEVFETFRRFEGSDRAIGGTGLGLAIVKAFSEAMGMAVAASNREDVQGARFSLSFPAELIVRDPVEGADI